MCRALVASTAGISPTELIDQLDAECQSTDAVRFEASKGPFRAFAVSISLHAAV